MTMSRKTTLLLVALLTFLVSTAFAGEKVRVAFLSGHVTSGSYSNSLQRNSILSETVHLSYFPSLEYGSDLKIGNSTLKRNLSLTEINGNSFGGTFFWTPKTTHGTLLGGRVSLLNMGSDDPNSDKTLIPYLSIIYKSPDLRKYIDLGYANTGYNDTTAHQITLTSGFFIFNDWAWLQSRAYYIDLSNAVQNKNNTFALEESLIYYVLPGRASLSFYGMLGQRIYAYSPDLQTAYNLSDIQNGSGGMSASYSLSKRWSVYGDVTYESYKNNQIEDRYSVVYSTAGAVFVF